ncbi:MAG: hypothetical protein M0P47_10390 [Bacteroidales bacterium]|nr:hypothetical protein [Bacteroidales bacterium]
MIPVTNFLVFGNLPMIIIKDIGELIPKDGEPGSTEFPGGSIEVEILGLLTIPITCITR